MNSASDPGYSLLQRPEQIFAFVGQSVGWRLVGRLQVDLLREGRPLHRFDYAKAWREDGFALDPLHLPLDRAVPPSDHLFGALADAGPDRWGSRLLAERFELLWQGLAPPPARRRIMSDYDRLLLAGDDRVGALAFGPTAQAPLLHPAAIPIRSLAALEQAMMRFDQGEAIASDLARLAAGTSLGGARPKASVRLADGSLWLAKFRRQASDAIDMVRAEHACMSLAARAGIQVAETRIQPLGQREALLVRRFDRGGEGDGTEGRLAYLSAFSLTGARETDTGGSYLAIADAMRTSAMACPLDDLHELYRRMVFNAACGNTDDHLKNHGFIRRDGRWRLSPAFDMVPHVEGDEFQALSVGLGGTTASTANLLSACQRFGLEPQAAAAIVQQILEILAGWRQHFAACGVMESDLRRIDACLGRITPPASLPAKHPG